MVTGAHGLANVGRAQFGRRIAVEEGDTVAGVFEPSGLLSFPGAAGAHEVVCRLRYILRPELRPGQVERHDRHPARPYRVCQGGAQQADPFEVRERVRLCGMTVRRARLFVAGTRIRIGHRHHQVVALPEGDLEQLQVLIVYRLESSSDTAEFDHRVCFPIPTTPGRPSSTSSPTTVELGSPPSRRADTTAAASAGGTARSRPPEVWASAISSCWCSGSEPGLNQPLDRM